MNSRDVMDKLFAWSKGDPYDYSKTCDTLKFGDPDREVRKVATTMFPTPEVIRAAHRWGADLLIVHEPTFYSHFEVKAEHDPVIEAKERLLEEAGMTLWRFHDHPHVKIPDMIAEGELAYLELDGDWKESTGFGSNRFELREPITPRALARRIEEKLHVAHVRVCGAADEPCTKLSLGFGAGGGTIEALRDPGVEVVLVGEACEWMDAEYARDAAQLGFRKALLFIGHVGSERDGMRLLADRMRDLFPALETRYFECGEAYGYPETMKTMEIPR